MNMSYLYLGIAIVLEVFATSLLKASAEFTNLVPSLFVVVGYVVSFYCLTLALRSFPIGVAYAIWTGIGVTLITLIATIIYKEIPDLPALIGTGLIISGVVVIQLYSTTIRH